jgi:branched-chain amino acid transport system substrate-binding protein
VPARSPTSRFTHRIAVLLSALLACALLAAPGCRVQRGSEVVLGALVARTGARALWGEDLYRGLELAVEQANARGGLLGRRIRLAAADDASRDDQAGALVTRLCEREGALAVFGEISSVASERGAQAAGRRGVPFVGTGNTARDITRVGDFAFRTALTDAEQAQALARHVRQALQKRRAAIVYRRSSLLQLLIADAFAQTFRTTGGEVVLRDTFTDDDTEMVHLAARVRASGADVLFVPALAGDAARMALAARHGRVTAQLAGTDGWISPELRRVAGEAVLGALVPLAFAPPSQEREGAAMRPEVEHFVQTFRERYHAEPGVFAALGYDAVRWVLRAAQRVPTLEPRALRDALAGSGLEDAVAGAITVDARRVLARPVQIVRIEATGLSAVAVASP